MGPDVTAVTQTSTILRKTWKRETAMVLLVWLIAIITWITLIDIKSGVELIKVLIPLAFAFAAAMFGVQAWQQKTAAELEGRPPAPFPGHPYADVADPAFPANQRG